MGMNLYAYIMLGNTHSFAPSRFFNSLNYMYNGQSFMQYSSPVEDLLLTIVGRPLLNDTFVGNGFLFTPEQVGEVIMYMNERPCPHYMEQELYNNLLEFFSICYDNNFIVSVR